MPFEQDLQSLLTLTPAVLAVALNAACALWSLRHSAFSALYWSSLAAVCTVPLVLDVLFGLPEQSFLGSVGRLTMFAEYGIQSAAVFALGHIAISAASYGLVRALVVRMGAFKNRDADGSRAWLVQSSYSVAVFGAVFLASSIVAIAQRSDLSRDFNDFLDPGANPQYETYFFLASSPLIAMLWAKRVRSRFQVGMVTGIAVAVAYFLGIRYYMFPYVGYVLWMYTIDKPGSTYSRLRRALLIGAVAWGALTLWGVVRALGIRDNPFALVDDPSIFDETFGYSLLDRLLVGNELSTRLTYYDLMARLEFAGSFRGFDAIAATVQSAVYPFILSSVGVPLPISNAKLIYELQSGVVGTGVSSGSTVFGNDWFSWGWWGMLVGGIGMGTLLVVGDAAHHRRGVLWLIVGPMWTYQLIFLARGGTDVWLGLWGRFLPIALVLLVATRVLGRLATPRWLHGPARNSVSPGVARHSSAD